MSADLGLIELAQKVQVIQTNRAEDLPAALVEVTSAAASCSTKCRKGIVRDRVCTPLDNVRPSW